MSVMNAIMVPSKVDVVFVVEWVLRMRIIVENVSNKKRIVMDVPKLSIWEPPRRICFMNEKSMDSRNDSSSMKVLYYCTGDLV